MINVLVSLTLTFIVMSVLLGLWWCAQFAVRAVSYLIGLPVAYFLPRLVQYWSRQPVTDKSIPTLQAGDVRFKVNGTPYLSVILDGRETHIELPSLLALLMQNQSVGKEASIPGSDMLPISKPSACFSFFNGDTFVGCGFRMRFGDKVFGVTAKHVYDRLGGEVYVRHGTYRYSYTPKVYMSANNMDFVLLHDSYMFPQGKILTSAAYSRGDIFVKGTVDGTNWFSTMGFSEPQSLFKFTHACSTVKGWSGAPVMNKDGHVVGVHTGSIRKDGTVVNEATAICDIMAAYFKHTKTNIGNKESYSDYDHEEWRETVLGSKREWRDTIIVNKQQLQLYDMGAGFSFRDAPWADDVDDDMFSVRSLEAAVDFQRAPGQGRSGSLLRKDATTTRLRKLRKLQESALTQEDYSDLSDVETERSLSQNSDQSRKSTTPSRRPRCLGGQCVTRAAFSKHLDFMEACLNKTVNKAFGSKKACKEQRAKLKGELLSILGENGLDPNYYANCPLSGLVAMLRRL
nr:MAG: hypothetical protein 1 [Barnaviridae sp.]